MALEEKRQALGREGMAAKPEKPSSPEKVTPPPKRDTSIFKGKTILERGTFDYRLQDPNLFSTTNLGRGRITEIGKKLFGNSGDIKPSDLDRTKRELDLGKFGKYRDLSEQDKKDAYKLLKGISGK